MKQSTRQVVVIGAGPAGLTAAYELVKLGAGVSVLEKDSIVGGLSRTARYKGYSFDMGGHRFFTKVPEVERMWREVLGEEFLRRPRLSRIYYDGVYFDYPLKPWNALSRLGPYEAVRVALSYIKWQVRPHTVEESFEHWVTNRFGRRLFLRFFRSYTEKVWGVPCTELRAEWAAQRIKDLSLRSAIMAMLFTPRRTIKTLIEEFDYPRLGPGMMWETVAAKVGEKGGTVRLDAPVLAVHHANGRVTGVTIDAGDGRTETVEGTDFVSTMPVTELIAKLHPKAPGEVLDAATWLSYRSFLTVCLIVERAELFPDNWIYIHDPDVHVGRIQNYKNWSAEMVPDATKTGLGLEYFCDEGDALWNRPDDELIDMAKRELAKIGLARADEVTDGCVFRMPKAYPVYDSVYAQHLESVKTHLATFENLQTIGRNGLHRYNNQDHAMVTGMLAVRNLMFGERNDVWSVNTDQEYHEEILEEQPALVDER
jgi:protoporphyrinogen oxidase